MMPTDPENGFGPDYITNNEGIGIIDGTRDLVDFFPLWLDLKQLIEVFPPGQYAYYLKHEDAALNFSYTDLKPSGSDAEKAGSYVRQLSVAHQLQNAPAFQITSSGVQLTADFVNKINNEGKGVILIEGRYATTKPLILEIRKGNDSVATISFEISCDSVEKMYRHYNIRWAVDPWAGFDYGRNTELQEPANYPDNLCNTKNFVYVHGYNTNGTQARGWHAEMFKRMYWSGSRAKFYGVSWAGDRNQAVYGTLGLRTPNFHKCVNDAFMSAYALQQFSLIFDGEVTIAAHSLGNLVVSSAQHDWKMNVTNYYLVDAALSMEGLQADATQHVGLQNPNWATYQDRLWASEWHKLFSGTDDLRKNLTWRGRVANYTGRRINFYSDVSGGLGDHVMRTPAEQDNDDAIIQFNSLKGAFIGGDADGRAAFCFQERLKGNFLTTSMGSTYGGWKFNLDWHVFDPEGGNPHFPAPEETGHISNPELCQKPFFHDDSPTELYGTSGSQFAFQNRNLLLSEMIPARTLAVGGNVVTVFGTGRNFNMQSTMHVGWPDSRTPDGEPVAWLHGDLKDVSFTYIFPLFDKWTELGQLK